MREKEAWKVNGFLGLLFFFVVLGIGVWILVKGIFFAIDENVPMAVTGIVAGSLLIILSIIFSASLVIVQPNQAAVITFFGRYSGSIREAGFYMIVPFSTYKKISLRVRNFNSAKLKVNDQQGNPIEIASVIVFKVVDTAKAMFDVDNYEEFVEIQSETTIRHIASLYPYDLIDQDGFSLRGNTDEIAAELGKDLQKRLSVAGVEVLEARLTHLAYATEIAGAMLQRQQAAAILAARQIIVEGAVGMVQMVIKQLEEDGMVALDEERKANMVNNLMVAIVSERGAQPVINAGTLY